MFLTSSNCYHFYWDICSFSHTRNPQFIWKIWHFHAWKGLYPHCMKIVKTFPCSHVFILCEMWAGRLSQATVNQIKPQSVLKYCCSLSPVQKGDHEYTLKYPTALIWLSVRKASMEGFSVLSCHSSYSRHQVALFIHVCHLLTTLCHHRMGFLSGWVRHW